jgi:hypothetical protein
MRTSDGRSRAAASTDHDEQSAMGTCTICDLPIEGPRLTDCETGLEFHAACVAERVPQDAVGALVAALALVLVPTVLVWAG